ncbi:MerR family transcriptional regulator [Ruania halotolerans]|uniref:MerR family transcriptional regulator n=1 Tax=Ruania halotolerans TaxID=2897773 RepID=UPI001E3CCDFD|nr:MerR family transcriptional regulator [Ruania halotolerans]UFU07191.1 MerR family transcriptional regulator [Ruania halotolerans]
MGQDRTWKVGELSRVTGLTVRTLHHWGDVGLIVPTARTSAGHRLYTESDVERVYQVLALRRLGVDLATAGALLNGSAEVGEVLTRHLAAVEAQIVALRRLRDGLEATLATASGRSSDDFLDLIRKVIIVDETVQKHFSPEQLTALAERKETDGERITAVEAAWPDLIGRVQHAIDAGVDPTSEDGRALAREWHGLLHEFHQGDAQMRESLYTMQQDNAETIRRDHGGPSPEQIEFITRASA